MLDDVGYSGAIWWIGLELNREQQHFVNQRPVHSWHSLESLQICFGSIWSWTAPSSFHRKAAMLVVDGWGIVCIKGNKMQ
jgi:hypothetical protein